MSVFQAETSRIRATGRTRPPVFLTTSQPALRTFLTSLLIATAQLAFALEPVRDQEIAQCLPGEMVTWGDGQDRPAISSPMVFVYDHAMAPAWFAESLVLSTVEMAAQAWSGCGVASRVLRGTAEAGWSQGAILVRWSEKGSASNFGLANLTQRTLSLGPAAFQMLKQHNPSYDARQTLQMVISHEMGHLFGLMAHSRRCVDVTSYYDNGRGEKCQMRGASQRSAFTEYRAVLPTACDLQRCRIANATDGATDSASTRP